MVALRAHDGCVDGRLGRRFSSGREYGRCGEEHDIFSFHDGGGKTGLASCGQRKRLEASSRSPADSFRLLCTADCNRHYYCSVLAQYANGMWTPDGCSASATHQLSTKKGYPEHVRPHRDEHWHHLRFMRCVLLMFMFHCVAFTGRYTALLKRSKRRIAHSLRTIGHHGTLIIGSL